MRFLGVNGLVFAVVFIFSAGTSGVVAQQLDYNPKILLVTAHPDDDALVSATVFKTTRMLNGTVDLALMTNGEGGYRFSTLGNYIYGKELDREEVGRKWIPNIRKKELMAGGDIVGLRNYYFFDQKDEAFALDVEGPVKNWETDWVLERMEKILETGSYDFVLTMLPHEETHAHHKASALFALQAVERLPVDDRPVVLAATITGEAGSETEFSELEGYPITRLNKEVGPFEFDREQSFGHNDRLNYKIVANWVIAEHKSQGTMQLNINRGRFEQFWYYALNDAADASKAEAYFEAVDSAVPEFDGE